jgi:dolichol-phosphate mannosyltransferase
VAYRAVFQQFIKFLIGGTGGVILYYLLLWALTEFSGLWYMASAVAASIANYTTNFLVQKYWTFQNKDISRIRSQAVLYGLMVAALFILNLSLLYVFVEYGRLHYLVAQVISTCVCTIISYFGTRTIFAGPKPVPAAVP